MNIKVKVVWYYEENIDEDYSRVDVFINDKKAISYRDDYHDGGYLKINGFIDCLNFLGYQVQREDIRIIEGE